MLSTLLTHPLIERLAEALVHSLWSGLIIASLLGVGLALIRNSSTGVRNLLLVSALALWLATPLVTFWAIGTDDVPVTLSAVETAPDNVAVSANSGGQATEANQAPGTSGGSATRRISPAPLARLAEAMSSYAGYGGWILSKPTLSLLLAIAALAWLAVATFLLLSTIVSLAQLRRLAATGRPLPALQLRVDRLARNLGLHRRVPVTASIRVDSPSVLGLRQPQLLLPVTTTVGLSSDQLDLVLAHELAHVKRSDHWLNLWLRATESLLFFHPLTWWLTGMVRLQREHACDELAIAATGGTPLQLAETLTRLEGARRAPVLGLAATGQPTNLVYRVRRLLGHPPPRRSPTIIVSFLIVALVAVWLATGVAIGSTVDQPATSAMTIVIDPGHGSRFPGARGFVEEHEVVMAVALKLEQLLGTAGIHAVLSHRDDVLPSETLEGNLAARLLATTGSDLFVSLHASAATDQWASGVTSWIAPPGDDPAEIARHGASLQLANLLQSQLIAATGSRDRGVKAQGFFVLRNSPIPSVMVDLGFVTNPTEGPRLAEEDYQDLLAGALAEGILVYLRGLADAEN